MIKSNLPKEHVSGTTMMVTKTMSTWKKFGVLLGDDVSIHRSNLSPGDVFVWLGAYEVTLPSGTTEMLGIIVSKHGIGDITLGHTHYVCQE